MGMGALKRRNGRFLGSLKGEWEILSGISVGMGDFKRNINGNGRFLGEYQWEWEISRGISMGMGEFKRSSNGEYEI